MIVVIDTNVWKQELYLTSGASAALKLYLRRSGAVVALPEVIELEIRTHLRTDLLQMREELGKSHGRLVALFGKLKSVELPTEKAIDELIDTFFERTGLTFREVPFSLASARDSLVRTIEKKPPSATTQQFKDGVIWADCLALSEEDEVVLVTNDTAFYGDRKLSNGLADELVREARELRRRVRVVPKLADLLDVVKSELRVDTKTLVAAIMDSPFGSDVRASAGADSLTLGPPAATAKYFATENPQHVYVDFELSVMARDNTGEERGEAEIRLIGGCLWDEAAASFTEFGAKELWMEYVPPSPLAGHRSVIAYGVGSASKFIKHRVRTALIP